MASERRADIVRTHTDETEREETPLLSGYRIKRSFLKLRWRVLLSFTILWVACVLINAAYSVIGSFFPLEALKQGSNSLYTGIIISCAPFSVFVFSPIFGYCISTVGLRFSLLSGMFFAGGAYILLGLTYLMPAGWVFIMMCILLRLIEGVGSALFFTGVFCVAPQIYPSSIGTVTGMLEAAGGFGYAIGPPIGGILYAAGGYGLPFWVTGGSILLILVLSLLLINTSDYEAHCTIDYVAMWRVSVNFKMMLLFTACVVSQASFAFVYPIFQPFLFTEFGLSEEIIGFVYLSGAIVYMMVALFIGKLSDKKGRYLIISGFAIRGLSFFFIGPADFISTPKLWLTILAFSTASLGSSSVNVPIFGDLLHSAKRVCPGQDDSVLAGIVSGLVTSATSLGQFIGPLVGGALNHVMNFQSCAVVVGEVLIAQSVLLLGVTFIDWYHSRRIRSKSTSNGLRTGRGAVQYQSQHDTDHSSQEYKTDGL